MATTEDDLAKKQVQEAVWVWTGRLIVLLVTFGFGFFAAWILWGAGVQGAPALRQRTEQLEAQVIDLKKQRTDIEGQKTVCVGRLDQCISDLQKARATAAGTQ
jgi:hypothetical protein